MHYKVRFMWTFVKWVILRHLAAIFCVKIFLIKKLNFFAHIKVQHKWLCSGRTINPDIYEVLSCWSRMRNFRCRFTLKSAKILLICYLGDPWTEPG